jgi:multidrug efflux pump
MSLSTPFIHRPVGTTLLTVAVMLAGALAYTLLPVAPLPQVDSPTIQISASLPGASPETMASAVAAPLERQFALISDVTEMTSASYLGTTSVTLTFDLSRNIDAAARDVQAAINAASGQLPPNLPNNPHYRKVNPADAPILILSLTSKNYTKPRMYDVASTILQQKISQVPGVGQVYIGGGAAPAVRVDVNPTLLNKMGLGLEEVRNALANSNANRPQGEISGDRHSWSISTTDQLLESSDYHPVIVAYRNGAPVRLADIATITDGFEDIRTAGIFDGQPSITIIIFRQPGANIIETNDRVRDLLPQLRAQIPAAMDLSVAMDRSGTIRDSVHDVQITLMISIALVILVVFLFLRNPRATFIPSVAVPVSLLATFVMMYVCGYSVDNLSLMALTIATGFVVDDAIVVIENITRHLEEGMEPLEAALLGAKEIGFTVVSISLSLIAVFIPILLMGGVVGRLFREFAVVLSVAVAVSMVVSLTTTPMMCAMLLKRTRDQRHGRLYRASEMVFEWVLGAYETTLIRVLRHPRITMLVLLSTIGFTIYLYVIVPKGLFPQQDTGRLTGTIQADQGTSFQQMEKLLVEFAGAVSEDPAVDNVIAFTGGGGGGGSAGNTARMYASLKPLDERRMSADQVIARLRAKTAKMSGASLIMQPVQDIRIGGRPSSAQFQYTLRGDNLEDLNEWGPRMLTAMRKLPEIVDVMSDQQNRGLQVALTIDREAAARLGVSPQRIDDALYDAFGQRQVSTIYKSLNQYRVVMEVEQEFWQNTNGLKYLYIRGPNGAQIPLSAVCKYEQSNTPLSVNHSGKFPSVTISFNLAPDVSLGKAVDAIQDLAETTRLPETINGSFSGTAQAFQASLSSQPILILAALVTVYIVLGMLYESYIHPITILSTLPSAGVGALLALLLCDIELSVISMIGIILLIGIVKKNAIIMIDFALDVERRQGLAPYDAILQACVLRFRPITMTTMAALLGGLPLALGIGNGAELRRPLGIAIVGGLIFSQMLTLYTTPVVYLYLDQFRLWCKRKWHGKAVHEELPAISEVSELV